MKKTFFILLIIILVQNTVSKASDVSLRNRGMKSFQQRVQVYIKCLRGTCSAEETKIAKQEVSKDIVKFVVALSIFAGGGVFLHRMFKYQQKKEQPVYENEVQRLENLRLGQSMEMMLGSKNDIFQVTRKFGLLIEFQYKDRTFPSKKAMWGYIQTNLSSHLVPLMDKLKDEFGNIVFIFNINDSNEQYEYEVDWEDMLPEVIKEK